MLSTRGNYKEIHEPTVRRLLGVETLKIYVHVSEPVLVDDSSRSGIGRKEVGGRLITPDTGRGL